MQEPITIRDLKSFVDDRDTKSRKLSEVSLQSRIPRLPKLRLRGLISTLKLFQPCCFPIIPSSKLSSRRPSAVKPRSASVVYTIKTCTGRLGVIKSVDNEVLEVVLPVIEEIKERLVEARLNYIAKGTPVHIENIRLRVISYKTQVVVGLNYFPKIQVDDGAVYLHARIYQPVQGEPFLTDLNFNKTGTDEIEYF